MNIKNFAPKRDKYADYVRCCDCGSVMLVKTGTDDCPICKAIGTLVWQDDNSHVVNVKDFKKMMRSLD